MSCLLDTVFEAYDVAGCSVLPARSDGSKFPRSYRVPADCTDGWCVAKRARGEVWGWKHATHARMNRAALEREFRHAEGLCIVTGAISGNLVMFETDTPEMADQLRAVVAEAGWGDVMARLDEGYRERTPKGGTHWLLRRAGATGRNATFARRPKRPDEKENEHDLVQVLVEDRAEGGQTVVAPSHGRTHPSGRPYVLEAGGFTTIPTIGDAEWDGLVAAARSLDQMPKPKPRARPSGRQRNNGESIADDFNAQASWAEILEPYGWTLTAQVGENDHWGRPGRSGATSATINSEGDGVLYVFTSSTVLEPEQAYSKFAAYAALAHGGDMSAAARAIRHWWRRREAS